MADDRTTLCIAGISCPCCKKRLRVPEGLKAHVKVSCRVCGHVFRTGETRPTGEPPLDHAQFESEADQTGNGSLASERSARRRSVMKPALTVFTSCLLVVVVAGFAQRFASDSTKAEEGTTFTAVRVPSTSTSDGQPQFLYYYEPEESTHDEYYYESPSYAAPSSYTYTSPQPSWTAPSYSQSSYSTWNSSPSQNSGSYLNDYQRNAAQTTWSNQHIYGRTQ
jgi:hypothetical protein